MRLENKLALITGASRGIGKAIALTFAKEGADLVINFINSTMEAGEVVKEIKSLGRNAIAIKADVSRRSEVDEMVSRVMGEFGRIDILVNNAGITRRVNLLDATEEDWDMVMNTNLKGMFNCTQAVARHMVESKSGKIINMASRGGLGTATKAKNLIYSVSKGAVFTFTKKVAHELGKYGINVNSIAPGPTITDFQRRGRSKEELDRFIEEKRKFSVLGMVATPQDIADVALFLASQESRLITGQVIVVDAGGTDYLSHSA